MGKTSSEVKNRYRNRVYDTMSLAVAKGKKAEWQAHAATRGESLAGFLTRAADEAMERDTQESGEGQV